MSFTDLQLTVGHKALNTTRSLVVEFSEGTRNDEEDSNSHLYQPSQ